MANRKSLRNKRFNKSLSGMNNIFFATKGIRRFYKYEGRLALEPIINFLRNEGKEIKGTLADFGSGDKPYKLLFPNISNYISIDLFNISADLQEDIKKTSLNNKSVDCILCTQAIEHDSLPCEIIKEIKRVLKKNGLLILSAPQMGRLHGEPYDYWRFTKWGLKYLLEKNGFEIIKMESHGGFFRAFGSHFNFFLIETLGKIKLFKIILRLTLINFNNYIFGILDKYIKWNKDTLGYNVLAKKRGE